MEAFDGIHIGHLMLRSFMISSRHPLLRIIIPCDTLVAAKRGEVTHTLQERRQLCELLFPGCDYHFLFDSVPLTFTKLVDSQSAADETTLLGFENCGIANALAIAHNLPLISLPIDMTTGGAVSTMQRKLSLSVPVCPKDPKARRLIPPPPPPPPPPGRVPVPPVVVVRPAGRMTAPPTGPRSSGPSAGRRIFVAPSTVRTPTERDTHSVADDDDDDDDDDDSDVMPDTPPYRGAGAAAASADTSPARSVLVALTANPTASPTGSARGEVPPSTD